MDFCLSGRSGHRSVFTAHACAVALTVAALSPPAAAGDGPPAAFSKTLPSHFLAPSAAAQIVLPGRAMAASPDERRAALHEKALIVRAEADAAAAAEVRRRAEDLSRRFLDDAKAAAEAPGTFQTTSITPVAPGVVASETVMQGAEAALLPVVVPVQAEPVQSEFSDATPPPVGQPLILETHGASETAVHSDALEQALRQVAAAEARATAERRARLAAEAEAKAAVERALDAMARADRETKAAARRNVDAEQRAANPASTAQKQAGVRAAAASKAAARREADAAKRLPPPKNEEKPSLLSKIFGGSKSSGSQPSSPPPFALGVVQSIQN